MAIKIQFPPEGDERGSTWRQEIAPRPESRAVDAFGAREELKEIRHTRAHAEREALAGRTFNPINQTGGWATEVLDLSKLVTAGAVPIDTAGFGIFYKRSGSAAGGLLDLELGGQAAFLAPGEALVGPFEKFSVRLNPLSAVAGSAVLLIAKDPRVDFRSAAVPPQSSISRDACGVDGAGTQAVNSAAGNQPDGAGDGVSLLGVRGYRVVVSAQSGFALSGGGQINIWKRPSRVVTGKGTSDPSPTSGGVRWAATPLVYADLSAVIGAVENRDWVSPDEEVFVGDGEIYAEARNVTATGGALIVAIETW